MLKRRFNDVTAFRQIAEFDFGAVDVFHRNNLSHGIQEVNAMIAEFSELHAVTVLKSRYVVPNQCTRLHRKRNRTSAAARFSINSRTRRNFGHGAGRDCTRLEQNVPDKSFARNVRCRQVKVLDATLALEIRARSFGPAVCRGFGG